MNDQPSQQSLSPRAAEELKTNALRIRAAACALRLWERIFTEEDRQRLGGDLQTAWRKHSTAGMWMMLRGVSLGRAVVEVAHALNLIDASTAGWLLRELGEVSTNPEVAIEAAVASGALVITEHPRTVYWKGKAIDIPWQQRSALWNYFWELCRHAKAGQAIDHTTFPGSKDPGVVAKQKSRLINQCGFPTDLADHIKPVGRYGQQLALAPQHLRLFETVVTETLREHTA